MMEYHGGNYMLTLLHHLMWNVFEMVMTGLRDLCIQNPEYEN